MQNHFCRFFRAVPVGLAFLLLAGNPIFAADWRPIDPAHLAMKAPALDKNADAEVLLWDVRIEDNLRGSDLQAIFTHMLRIKVFTAKGAQEQATIDVPLGHKVHIADLAGRTVQPDGTIVELKKDAIFERVLAKAGGRKATVRSFAMPAVVPGSIVEYRYREIRDGQVSNYARLHFQRNVPVHLVQYHIKPLQVSWLPYNMQSYSFHSQATPFEQEPDGFYRTSVRNVPPYQEEPYMPPEDQVRPWMLLYYAEDRKLTPDKFWKETGRELHKKFREQAKPNDDIKRLAIEAVAGLSTDEEKLAKLLQTTRSLVKNIFSDTSGITAEQRQKYKPNKTAGETLKQRIGTGYDINMLFAALAIASGLDARLASTGNRSDFFFDPNFMNEYFLVGRNIAVKTGGGWHFYDAASPHVPQGMLDWREELQQALVTDPKEPSFVMTPLTPPERSQRKRTADLVLDGDGTLAGTVQVAYTGHQGITQRQYYEGDSDEARKQSLRERLQNSLGAEVSDVQIKNASDPLLPFTYSFNVRIPGYAQRTGKRLFVQPGLFQRGTPARFPTSTRKHDIYFEYPWSEEDNITIKLPAEFDLDRPTAPASLALADAGTYKVRLATSTNTATKQKSLVYERSFAFGKNNNILFPASSYLALKKIFDVIHEQDQHMVTLRQGAVATPTGGLQ